jgi:hypothetical protein
MPRSQRLRLSLDAKYPRIIAEAEARLRRVFPACQVGRVVADRGSTVVLWVYHRHLACLFPQHGPGKKHERPMELEAWQTGLVAEAPWSFLRGCIRSDGCSFVNRTGRYSYLSYESATGRTRSSASSRRPALASACSPRSTPTESGCAGGPTSPNC